MKFRYLSVLLLLTCIVSPANARIMQFGKQAFDLDDPSTGNNVFTTTFSFGIFSSAPIQVDYTDQNMTGIQANLVIDFTDLNNPIVQSVEFDGEPGDIQHSFPQSTVNIGGINVTPNGIQGFLRTQSGPIAVNNPGGTFPSGDTNLVARQGTVTIPATPPIVPNETILDLNTFPLGGFNDPITQSGDTNTISIVPNLGLTGAGIRTYDLAITSRLEDTLLTFGDLVFAITGTFRGTSQIAFQIPEPTSLISALLAFGLIGIRTRI